MSAGRHRYPKGPLVGDSLRGGLGLLATVLPLLLLDLAVWVAIVFSLLSVLFAIFLVRVIDRHVTVVETGAEGIAVVGLRTRRIAWARIASLRLAYYSTRRDRQRGWMSLTFGDGRQTIGLESTLEDFDPLVERVAAAALANGVELDQTTVANLDALGLDASPAGEDEAKEGWIGTLTAEAGGGREERR